MLNIVMRSETLKTRFLDLDREDDTAAFPGLLEEYLSLFHTAKRIEQKRTAEAHAVCEVNVAFVDALIEMEKNLRKMDRQVVDVARAALDWNLSQADIDIDSEILLRSYIRRAEIDFIFGLEDLGKILTDLEEAVSIAYWDQARFQTVSDIYDLRAMLFAKLGMDEEATASAREAAQFMDLEVDYQSYLNTVEKR